MRIREVITYEDGKALAEIALASTETKPTDGLATGSTITEADTGKTFVLDEDSATWTEYTSGGGGGGGSSYTLLYEEDVEVSSATGTVIVVKEIAVDGIYTSDLLFVRIRDKAGRRQGYFLESEAYIANPNPVNGITSIFSTVGRNTIYDDNGAFKVDNGMYGGFGVFVDVIESADTITISARTGRGNVGGTYHVAIYKLSLPDGTPSPFS